MKKILILLLLMAPLFAYAQKTWFIADAVRFNTKEEWKKCDIRVSIGDDWKINIYAKTNHTIRKIKDLGDMKDDDGNVHALWSGVDQDGLECLLSLTFFKDSPYMRLTINFEEKGLNIFYMLRPDE